MAKIKLKKIAIRNFGTVQDAEVEFPSSGFVLVTGKNKTSTGKLESVGSGKSLLGEAIGRTLFGIPGRFSRFSGYSTNDEGNTYIRLEVSVDDKNLVVEIGYKCQELSRTGESLRFTVDGNSPIMRGHFQETRDELSKIIGMPAEVASWTVNIDGDKLNFNRLSESSAINLMMGVLNQPPWTELQKKVSGSLKKIKEQTLEAEGTLTGAKVALAEAGSFILAAKASIKLKQEEYEIDLRNLAQRKKIRESSRQENNLRLAEIKKNKEAIKKKIKDAEEAEAEKYHQAELELQRLESRRALSSSAVEKISLKSPSLQSNVQTFEAEFLKEKENYTRLKYLELNQARIKALAKRSEIEQANSKGISSWNLEKKELELKILTLRGKLAIEKIQQQSAVKDLNLELGRPNICPLLGCGKTWPKDNQDVITTLENELKKIDNAVNATISEFEKAEAKFSNFVKKVFNPIELPELPAENEVPSFPEYSSWQSKISESKAVLSTHEEELKTARDIVIKCQTDIDNASQVLRSLTKSSAVSGLSLEFETAGIEQDKFELEARRLDSEDTSDVVSRKEIDEAEVRLNERMLTESRCAEKVSAAAEEFVECSKSLDVISYWERAFGPTGIPNLIINESVGPLNAVSKKVGFYMTSGLLDVEYSTTKELVSGESRSELNIKATNRYGSTSVAGSSKGESGLLDLIVAETLAEVGQTSTRIGYKWCDEVAGSQDQVVRRSIFKFYKELTQKSDLLVFIVDHSVEVANYADKILVAEKTLEHGTKYYWQ